MKLPSLWPVAFFAGGILLSRHFSGQLFLSPRAIVFDAFALLCIGFLSLLLQWTRTALLLSAAVWICLGFAAASFSRASIPANLASSLIENGGLDESAALRWRGRLRSDPRQLPWGTRYEIDLDEAETASGITPVSGGLLLTAYHNDSQTELSPDVRAGERVEALAHALPIRNFGDPGSFDQRAYLALQGIDLQGTLRSHQLLMVLGDDAHLTIANRIARLRGKLLKSVDQLFLSRPEQAALARAMLLGDRGFVEHDRVVEYQQTGVYHVLVLAGLHVGALTAFIIWVGRKLRIGLLPRTFLTLIAIGGYVAIVEDRPPILRAAIMAAVYLCAQLVYRRIDPLNMASLSALAILAVRPAEITDASFLLSFSAIGVIGALAVPWIAQTSEPYLRGLNQLSNVTRDVSHSPPVIQFRMELRAAFSWIASRLPQALAPYAPRILVTPFRTGILVWELIVLSTILQLGMMPPMAYYFHRVTLAGPLANVTAVLLTGLIVPFGLLVLAVSLLGRGLAIWLSKYLGLLLAALDGSVDWFAHWHRASYRIPGPPPFVIAIFAMLGIVLSATIRSRLGKWWQFAALLPLLAMAVVIGIYPFAPHLSERNLELTVLDIGQGDSLFVSFPGGSTMLVDGGGELGSFRAAGMHSGLDVGEDVVSPYLWSRGLKQIDVVALTHAHQDHLGGLPAVLENFRVKELWLGRDIAIEPFRQLIALAKERGVVVRHLKQGDSIQRGNIAGSILWPDNLDEKDAAKNDDSLVLRLTDGSQSFLLAGDIERPSERSLLEKDQDLGVNFLKVPHHGSKTSSTEPFLAAVHPQFAAISVGRDNSFGHPSPEVVKRLEAGGVRVYRTDRDGAITATTDGQSLQVTSFLRAKR